MAARARVVLVDGSWLTFRAYHAIPSSFSTASGLPTNAIFGFATMFRKLFAARSPTYGAVVFDPDGPTTREREYPAYKATRPEVPNDLRIQVPWIDQVVQTNGFPLLRVPGLEADDVIGTLARLALEAGHEVVIVTADKDFAQLVGPDLRMFDSMRDVTYDADLVKKKWGVWPNQIVDYLAMMGDAVDNIPGVPGIGAKTAATLLDTYGSLDGVLAHVEDLKGRQRTTFTENRHLAVLSQSLATIDQHAAIGVTFEDLAVQSPDTTAVNTLLRTLEFYSLLSAEEQTVASQALRDDDTLIHADADAIEAGLAALGRPVVVHPLFEQETEPPEFGGLVGLAFAGAGEGTDAFYVPLRSPRGVIDRAAEAVVNRFLSDPTQEKVAHDAKLLQRELTRRGVTLAGVVGDTMLASFLVDPTGVIPHDLGRVCKEFLHRVLPVAKSVVGSGQALVGFSKADVDQVGAYQCTLTRAISELWPILVEKVAETGQRDTLDRVDLPLSDLLCRMELAGIKVDGAMLAVLNAELVETLTQCEKAIHTLAGHAFNIGSTKQLAVVLFEELGLPVVKRTKTGYSTDAEVLERLAVDHEIARKLLEHRRVDKLINTYTTVLQRAISPVTGRVHATFKQTVGATGRLISTDPDLQRTPVRTDEGSRIRSAFVADEGNVIISADWSQIELRLLAHFSNDRKLVAAFAEDADVHARTAAELFGVQVAEVSSDQRRVGKRINFATIYGQGATALGQLLGIPRNEAKATITRYFELYADVRGWLDETVAKALETGYATTFLGRRRQIPELFRKNPMDRQAGERIAANTPIQGSAADLCKLAMLAIDRRLQSEGLKARMILQIHDELLFETPLDEVDAVTGIAREAMEHVADLRVPLKVDIGVGKSWFEAH